MTEYEAFRESLLFFFSSPLFFCFLLSFFLADDKWMRIRENDLQNEQVYELWINFVKASRQLEDVTGRVRLLSWLS